MWLCVLAQNVQLDVITLSENGKKNKGYVG